MNWTQIMYYGHGIFIPIGKFWHCSLQWQIFAIVSMMAAGYVVACNIYKETKTEASVGSWEERLMTSYIVFLVLLFVSSIIFPASFFFILFCIYLFLQWIPGILSLIFTGEYNKYAIFDLIVGG